MTYLFTRAAVSSSSVPYCTAGVRLGLGLTGKAWCLDGGGGGDVFAVVGVGKMHGYTPFHAPTHARPSLPINPNPNPTPDVQYGTELHDTAAQGCYTYSPLLGFEPETHHGSQYEADGMPMCHRASVSKSLFDKLYGS